MTERSAESFIPIKHPLLMLASVMLSTAVIMLDTTIANVALPHMQGSLSATQDQISWVLTSYIVASTIMIPASGWLAAKLGRRRLLCGCIAGFLIASMLCGAARTLEQMVLFRMLQGVFSAAVSPIGQALLMDHFPPAKRGQVLAVWGMGIMIGPILGPSLGGYLTEVLNWRWVFYINVPLCLIALLLTLVSVPQVKEENVQPLDFFGFGLLSIAIGALQLILDRGHSLNWFHSTEIVIETVLALLMLYLFIVHSATGKRTFLNFSLFRDRNMVVGFLMVIATQFVMMGQMALMPNFMQQLMHLPVDTTGYLLMPRGLGSLIGMIVTSKLINRVDARHMMAFGLVLFAITQYETAQINLYVSNNTIVVLGLLQGFGISFLGAPMTTLAFATLNPALRNEGTAMFSLMRNIGGSIGISVFFTRIAAGTQTNHQYLGESISVFANQPLPGAWDWHTVAGAMTLDAEVTRQAASLVYLDCYLIMAMTVIAIIPLCYLFKPWRPDVALRGVPIADH